MRDTLVALTVTLAIQMMTSLSMLAVPVLASAAAPDVGVSATYVGVFTAIVALGAMLSSIVGSALVPRFGAIRVSQVCLLSATAGLAIAMLAWPVAMALGAFLIGIGGGAITPASSHVLARKTPANLIGLIFSIKQTGVPLAGVVGGILVPAVVVAAGWRWALAVVALICLAVVAIAQPTRAALDADRDPHRRTNLAAAVSPLKVVFSIPPIRALALASFFYAGMQGCLAAYLVTYLVSDLGMSLVQAGAMLAVAQGAGIVGRIFWGAMTDRWVAPNRMFGLVGLFMATAAVLTAMFSTTWPMPALLAVCGLFGSAALGWNGVHLAQVARLAPPGTAGPATGGTVFFFFVGVMTGPPLFGAIVGSGLGYSAAFVLLALPTLAVALRFCFGARPLPARPDGTSSGTP